MTKKSDYGESNKMEALALLTFLRELCGTDDVQLLDLPPRELSGDETEEDFRINKALDDHMSVNNVGFKDDKITLGVPNTTELNFKVRGKTYHLWCSEWGGLEVVK